MLNFKRSYLNIVPNKNTFHPIPGLYGLIACGGNSSRMGNDKSMLVYHDKPQWLYLYDMLEPFCEQAFISCNNMQAGKMPDGYQVLTDLHCYSNSGPMAALLTAFSQFPGRAFLLIGCDYPFLTAGDIRSFLHSIDQTTTAAAFYNDAAGLYEPLLGYYPPQAAARLLKMHANATYSLQSFLKENNAVKFYPGNTQSIQSIDTKEGYIQTKELIRQKNIQL